MGVALEVWRARIGTFVQPVKIKTSLKVLELKHSHISLCIRTVLFLLLVCQCIESNPGPTTQSSKGRGNKAVHHVGRCTRNSSVDLLAPPPPPEQQPAVPGTGYDHGTISAWLRSEQLQSQDSRPDSAHTDSSNNQNTIDTTQLLLEIRGDIKCMNKKFDSLQQTVNELKIENNDLKLQNQKLSEEVNLLTTKVNSMENTLSTTVKRQDYIEMQTKRMNLKFYNVITDDNDDDVISTEQKVVDFIRDDLNVPDESFSFDRVTKLKSQSRNQPVLVSFKTSQQRDSVLAAFREKRKHYTMSIRIGEDLPRHVGKARSLLYPFFQECLNNNKKAYFKQDMLIVDGITYRYDNETKQPVPFEQEK